MALLMAHIQASIPRQLQDYCPCYFHQRVGISYGQWSIDSCRKLSKGTLPPSLNNTARGFQVSMITINLILRYATLVLMSSRLLVFWGLESLSVAAMKSPHHPQPVVLATACRTSSISSCDCNCQ